MFTRPRGSRNATFESLETALNDRNASANVSALVFPRFAGTAARAPFFAPAAVAVAGLNSPVHNFGVAQAFGGRGATFSSSVTGSSELVFLSPPCSASVRALCCSFESSCALSGRDFAVSLWTAFGIAGITGTAGRVDRWEGFGATGVASPGTGKDGCWSDEGVVGLVDSSRSDVGWLVEGVSGRGAAASPLAAGIVGSSTGSAERWDCGLLFRRALLAGQGRSGCDNHGNYWISARGDVRRRWASYWRSERTLQGFL